MIGYGSSLGKYLFKFNHIKLLNVQKMKFSI